MDAVETGRVAAEVEWSRRGFVMTSLATGFALSVQPVTGRDGSDRHRRARSRRGQDPGQGRQIPAYRAMPDKGGPFPTVLVVQEVFGVHGT